MDNTVIEAQARYLIQDRIQPTHRQQHAATRRRHKKLRRISWL
jgi:hypothetical protein